MRTLLRVATLPRDEPITPHPQPSELPSRLGSRATQPLASRGTCRAYAAAAGCRPGACLADEAAP